MKPMIFVLAPLFLIAALAVHAQDNGGRDKEKHEHEKSAGRPAPDRKATPEMSVRTGIQPVVIHLDHKPSEGHNRELPSDQHALPVQNPQAGIPFQQLPPQQKEQEKQILRGERQQDKQLEQEKLQAAGLADQQTPARHRLSYGRLHWDESTAPSDTTANPTPVSPQALALASPQAVTGDQVQNWNPANPQAGYTRPNTESYKAPGGHAAVAVHHHPYQLGYVRNKLKKIGVTAEPDLITDRGEILHTDRAHSTVTYPPAGPDNAALNAKALSPRHYNDQAVKDQMWLLNGEELGSRIEGFNASENQPGRYYWHQDMGMTACHFIDGSGYHWWGWYADGRCFWTRYYASRWWWYDSDFDRWCFWNNGFWWWQDPYHLGDLYCYNNTSYVPCNSAQDQEVVTAPSDANEHDYTSPDGSRLVKLFADSQDAFLYDTAVPAAFQPVYLASGVKSVNFSNLNNGRPLEILLILNDSSFDMFDSYGNTYNPGANEAEKAPAP